MLTLRALEKIHPIPILRELFPSAEEIHLEVWILLIFLIFTSLFLCQETEIHFGGMYSA